MTLHEAIIYVLEGYGSAMSSAEIAQEIFDKKFISATCRFYGSSQTDRRSCKKISTAFYC